MHTYLVSPTALVLPERAGFHDDRSRGRAGDAFPDESVRPRVLLNTNILESAQPARTEHERTRHQPTQEIRR